MVRTSSMINTAKYSTSKPSVKPLHGDNYIGVEPDIHLYEIEDIDKTEKGEEVEILILHGKSLMATKQNLVKS